MNIGILLFHEVNEFDVVIPYSILRNAVNAANRAEEVHVFTLAKSRNSVQTSNDLTITPLYAFASAPPLDMLIVPGGRGIDKALRDRAVAAYLPSVIPSLKLSIGISSGALLLGHYGLLRGMAATTHPDLYERLEDYEVLRVVNERIVEDDKVWTCNGSSAAMELAFGLATLLFGDEVGQKVKQLLNVEISQGQLF